MDDNYALNFAGSTGPEFTAIEGATEATYVATEPGHYRVIVTNTRNKADRVLPVEERPVSRITYAAQAPVLIGEDVNAKIFQIDSLTDLNCPTITMDSSIESDGYTVSWFLNEGSNSVPIVENIVLEPGVLVASFNPKNYEEKIIELSSDHDIDGAYYAIVTNHVNGSSAATTKPTYANMFKVTA